MDPIAPYIDHTLLKADATTPQLSQLCEEAVEHGFASVCVLPRQVAQAARMLYGSEVAVGTVVGFPLGAETSAVKSFQTLQATSLGATEIDMVIDLGAARELHFERVLEDICEVVSAAGDVIVKVIIECCLFDDDSKRRLTEVVAASGAHYVKTSTGFAESGATLADVALLSETAAGAIKVKAAGGIRDWTTFQEMLAAGADRIGTSAGVEIMRQWQASVGLV